MQTPRPRTLIGFIISAREESPALPRTNRCMLADNEDVGLTQSQRPALLYGDGGSHTLFPP